MPDPQSAIELAKTFFAGISAAAAAISVWQKSRDKQLAAKTFDDIIKSKRQDQETNIAAQQLVSIIPKDIISMIEDRADKCWTGYRKVLGGNYLPDEVDNATKAVQRCVCTELGRIEELNGSIPDRWQGQWNRFKCNL